MLRNDYVEVLRRRWWVVLVTALVAMTTAFVFARAQTPVYRSSVRLEVSGRIDYGQVLAMDRLLRQIAARVKTSTVAEMVDDRLHLGLGAGAILGKLQAQAYPDVLHIQIDVDDDTPERAERIAATTAEVVQERQAGLMASVPQQERIMLAILDRPSAGRLVWPVTRQIVLAAGLLGLLVGGVIAFGLHFIDIRENRETREAAEPHTEDAQDARPRPPSATTVTDPVPRVNAPDVAPTVRTTVRRDPGRAGVEH